MDQGHQISRSTTIKPMLLKQFAEDRVQLKDKLRALLLTIIKSHATYLKLQANYPTTEEKQKQKQSDETGLEINKLIQSKIIKCLSEFTEEQGDNKNSQILKVYPLFDFPNEKTQILQRIPDSWSQFATETLQSYSSELQVRINEIINWLQSYLWARTSDSTAPDNLVSQMKKLCDIFESLVQNLGNKPKQDQQHNYYITKLLKFKAEQEWSTEFMNVWLNLKKSAQPMSGSGLALLIKQWLNYDSSMSRASTKNIAAKITKKRINPLSISKILNPQQMGQDERLSKANAYIQEEQRKQEQRMSEKCLIKSEHGLKRQKLFTVRLYQTFRYIQRHHRFVGDSVDKKKIIGIECAKTLANGQVVFVRNLIRKVLQIAKTKNARFQSPIIGDELRYFSSQNTEVYDLLENKDILLRRNKQKAARCFRLQQRKFYSLKYPSKLDMFFDLKSAQQQKEQELEEQIKSWIENQKSFASHHNIGGKKTLLKYLESETKEEYQRVQQVVGAPSSRLKITGSLIADVVMQHCEWLFGAEQTFFRF